MKSLQFEETHFGKLFMQISNNHDPKIEPRGTPALTLTEDEWGPFKTTPCFRNRKIAQKFQKVS